MLMRVESSVTLNTKTGHYVKESRTVELDLLDAVRLLASDPELSERYQDVGDDPELNYELLVDAMDSTFYAIREGLLDALSKQVEEVEG